MRDFIVNRIFQSITYIIPAGSQKDCWLVDCGDVDRIILNGWHVRGVLLTHAHTDHIYGINQLLEHNPNAIIYTNESGKEELLNPRLNFSKYHDDVDDFVIAKPENVRIIKKDGELHLDDNLIVESMFTPGHMPSCITYKYGELLFTGDSYIPGVKVITHFPRSNKEQAAVSLERLQELERSGLKIMPGHWIENK